MRSLKFLNLVIVISLVIGYWSLVITPAWAVVPQRINIQGRLTPAPNVLTGGVVFSVTGNGETFPFTDAAPAYDRTTGIFNAVLDLTGAPAGILSNGDAAVGITAGGVTVTQPLNAVPYALRSAVAENALDANTLGGQTAAQIQAGAGNWTLSGANISNTNIGNVGIGLAAGTVPAAKLHVQFDNEAMRPLFENTSTAMGTVAGGITMRNSLGNFIYVTHETPDTTWITGLLGADRYSISRFDRGRRADEFFLVVNSSGNVGIGTTTPVTKFQVNVGTNQNLNVRSSNSMVSIDSLNDAGSAFANMRMEAEQFHLMTGNVGIGTAGPSQLLQVGPTTPTGSTPYTLLNGLRISGGDVTNTIWNAGNNIIISRDTGGLIQLTRTSAPTIGLTVDTTSGNVGIGTTTPNTRLELRSPNTFPAVPSRTSIVASTLDLANETIVTTDPQAQDIGAMLALGGMRDDAATNPGVFGGIRGAKENSTAGNNDGYLGFYTLQGGIAFAERMRISSLGNVGIGTATPVAQLHVLGTSGDAGSGSFIIGPTATANLRIGYVTGSRSWIQSHGSLPLYINELGNNVILNSGGGNVGIGTITPGARLHVAGDVRANDYQAGDGTELVTAGTNVTVTRSPANGAYTINSTAVGGIAAEADTLPIVLGRSADASTFVDLTSLGGGLTVAGDITASSGLSLGGVRRTAWPGSYWRPATAAGDIMNTNSGKVGIGTAAPGAKLDVQGDLLVGFGVDPPPDYAIQARGNTRGIWSQAIATGAVTNYGGQFRARGDNGIGVLGEATAAGVAATNYGGYFTAAGDRGRGAQGMATGLAGIGLWGDSTGTSGRGVYGRASGTAGRAVVGAASADGADVENYGGYFTSAGGNGIGVSGAVSGVNAVGVFGRAEGANGYGVLGNVEGAGIAGVAGTASPAVTSGYGVYGKAEGTNGRAVFGEATASGEDIENYGGVFTAAGDKGIGVKGTASGSAGRGVHGEASGAFGIGVYGITSGDLGFGVSGHGGSGSGTGVRGFADAGEGIYGESFSNYAIHGRSRDVASIFGQKLNDPGDDAEPAVYGKNEETNPGVNPGVKGESIAGYGVFGTTTGAGYAGVYGSHTGGGTGITGSGMPGVYGTGTIGVRGYGTGLTIGTGVVGYGPFIGVSGESNAGTGVYGTSISSYGIHGKSGSSAGIFGEGVGGGRFSGTTGHGVMGTSTSGSGVRGASSATGTSQAGVTAVNTAAGGVALRVQNVLYFVPRPSAPSSPAEGMVYYDSALNRLRVRRSGIWDDLSSLPLAEIKNEMAGLRAENQVLKEKLLALEEKLDTLAAAGSGKLKLVER